MSKIYTKTGDFGTTSINSTSRVDKDDVRIEANGELDELNSLLGVVKTYVESDGIIYKDIEHIQLLLMRLMSMVASGDASGDVDDIVEFTNKMETGIDNYTSERAFSFVLPGSSRLSSFLHLARCKARTAERRLWTVNKQYPLNAETLKFVNRLSDYLYVLALLS